MRHCCWSSGAVLVSSTAAVGVNQLTLLLSPLRITKSTKGRKAPSQPATKPRPHGVHHHRCTELNWTATDSGYVSGGFYWMPICNGRTFKVEWNGLPFLQASPSSLFHLIYRNAIIKLLLLEKHRDCVIYITLIYWICNKVPILA